MDDAGKEDDGGRIDPDAQTTVNDFLDFTEYLPSDMMRSLTLIGTLDETYTDTSMKLHSLTKTWGELPSLPASERPAPTELRASISNQLNQAISSRVFAHAEAARMSENVNRHYNKATILLAKLQAMMDNYPTEEQQALSPIASKSPQLSRSKLKGSGGGIDGHRVRQKKVPKITVPGEVLAPYDIEYDTVTDGTGMSSDEEDGTPAVNRSRTPATSNRIKIISSSSRPTPRPPARSNRASSPGAGPSAEEISANQAALMKPPPKDAEIGSVDAPWLQLTQYELAKLRKRMKKNATWSPSDTMVARELKALGRGPEDYKIAKKKAEAEGRSFDPTVPAPVVDVGTGTQQLPTGAISVDAATADELPTSNRGMKLNEAKKLKREALAKMAAEEAEESAKKMAAAAKLILGGNRGSPKGAGENAKDASQKAANSKSRTSSRTNGKRKRDAEGGDASSEPPEAIETPSTRSVPKRIKTETPVPPPQYGKQNHATSTAEASGTQAPITSTGSAGPPIETPVPLPLPYQSSSSSSVVGTAKSPTPNGAASNLSTITTTVPVKPPATETPVPLPRTSDRRKSVTPVVPPPGAVVEGSRRETRADAAKRSQQQQEAEKVVEVQKPQLAVREPAPKRVTSRANTPAKLTPGPEAQPTVRPGSRGKAMSQEPQPSLAIDRPRRASTARNTPAPDVRPPSRRSGRPAPGVVSTTKSGGNSAVGKRKAPPRKKARMTRREKGQQDEIEMEEVDDEGNPIDPNEPRYCICNRVSFGTMIQCESQAVSLMPQLYQYCSQVSAM
jgi:hypothetical protein